MTQKKIFPVLPIDIALYLQKNKSKFNFQINSYDLNEINKYCKKLYLRKLIKSSKKEKKQFFQANYRLYYQLAQLIFNLKTIKKLKKLKYNFILNNKLVNFEKIIDFYFKEYQTNNIKRFTNKKKHRNSLIQLFYNLLKFLYNFKNYFFVFIFNYKKIFFLNGASKEIKNFIKNNNYKSFFFLKNNYLNSNNYNHEKDFQNYCHKIFSKFGLVDKESKTLIEKITADFCNFSNHYYSIANSLKQIKNTNFFVRGSPNILVGFFLSSLKKKIKFTHIVMAMKVYFHFTKLWKLQNSFLVIFML